MRHSKVSAYPVSDDVPDQINCDTGVVEILRRTRDPEYKEHRLAKGRGIRTKTGLKSADNEYERRNVERGYYQEISQYYTLGRKQEVWTRPSLLLKGKHKHDHSTFRRHSAYPNYHSVGRTPKSRRVIQRTITLSFRAEICHFEREKIPGSRLCYLTT